MKFLTWMVACLMSVLVDARGAESLPRAQKFDAEIEAMLSTDKTNQPAPGGIVFTGSSSIRVWKSLAQDMAGLAVFNRGFGGSEMSDLNRYTRRIVVPLKPRVVVVYEGDNDLAGGKEIEALVEDFRQFIGFMRESLPETRVLFLAVKPSPSRRSLLEKQQLFNRRLKELVAGNPKMGFVDVATPMLGPSGDPREELFLDDRLHMKPSGYEVWTQVLRPVLQDWFSKQ